MSVPSVSPHPETLAPALAFRHLWWWDPVPDWIVSSIDKAVLQQVAVAQIEAQRKTLQAQVEATEKVLQLLGAKGR